MFSLKNQISKDDAQRIIDSVSKQINVINTLEKNVHSYASRSKVMKLMSIQNGIISVLSELSINEDCYIYLFIHNESSYFQYNSIKRNTNGPVISTFKLTNPYGYVDIKFYCGTHQIEELTNVCVCEENIKPVYHQIIEDTLYVTFKKKTVTNNNVLRFYKKEECLNENVMVKEVKLYEGTTKMAFTFPRGNYILKWFEGEEHKYFTPYYSLISFSI